MKGPGCRKVREERLQRSLDGNTSVREILFDIENDDKNISSFLESGCSLGNNRKVVLRGRL